MILRRPANDPIKRSAVQVELRRSTSPIKRELRRDPVSIDRFTLFIGNSTTPIPHAWRIFSFLPK